MVSLIGVVWREGESLYEYTQRLSDKYKALLVGERLLRGMNKNGLLELAEELVDAGIRQVNSEAILAANTSDELMSLLKINKKDFYMTSNHLDIVRRKLQWIESL